ncbi:MAG: glycosyltransferase family 1 protein [Bryobacteraceae bacterium]|jgi:glycosyltransferase involved in cell wall biosynthesis
MRVAIEAASLALSSGGLQRYTSELSVALARCFPGDEFYLTSDQPFRMPPGAQPNLKRGGGPTNALERRWWLWGLAREMRRLGADLVHGPDFAVPYIPGRPSVLTLHDLSPWMDHRWHGDAFRVRRRTPVLLEMGVATMVITPSESVRTQAMERFKLRPERVVAVPEAAAPWFTPVEPDTRRNRPYFLFVGTLEPRKNLAALVEAWREACADHKVDLVLAGRRRADCPPLPDEPSLEVLGEVPDEQLPALYSGALAFVYPSLYEGFGLPVLEAMQCGACVIASRAVAEAAGDAAIYADGAAELARGMRDLLEHPERAPEWRSRSLARAREFTWERTARATYEVYREARKRFGR